MRSMAREAVFMFIFSKLFNDDCEGLFEVLISQLNAKDKEFANNLLQVVNDNQQEFLDSLSNLSQNFKLDRVINADKCAIIIGMAELKYFTDTPIPVAIDEAVKLVVKYSTESSAHFVNGILAEFVKGVDR